jgi:hypothetical protein
LVKLLDKLVFLDEQNDKLKQRVEYLEQKSELHRIIVTSAILSKNNNNDMYTGNDFTPPKEQLTELVEVAPATKMNRRRRR